MGLELRNGFLGELALVLNQKARGFVREADRGRAAVDAGPCQRRRDDVGKRGDVRVWKVGGDLLGHCLVEDRQD